MKHAYCLSGLAGGSAVPPLSTLPRVPTWLRMTTLWSCMIPMMRSQTVVLPDAVPPATPMMNGGLLVTSGREAAAVASVVGAACGLGMELGRSESMG